MAIVKMKKLRAISMRARRDALLLELQKLGCVELTSQEQTQNDPDTAALVTPDAGALMEPQAERQTFKKALDVLDRYAPQKTPMLAPRPEISVDALLDETDAEAMLAAARELDELSEGLKALVSEESKEKLRIETLTPWKGCALPLDCAGTKYAAVAFGALPLTADTDALSAALAEETAAELYKVSEDISARYVYVIYLRADGETVMRILREHGFTAPAFGDGAGNAADGIAEAAARLAEIAKEREETERKIADAAQYRDGLQRGYDRAGTKVEQAEAAGKLLRLQSTVLMEGWAPAAREKDVAAVLERFDCAYEFEAPVQEEYPEVPVSLKNGPVTRSLNTVTNMYSLPAYDGVDPNPLMAPFFIFFYGMMMADMGYGLLMILGCLVVLKKKKPANAHFWELFLWCGVATFIWGIFTASFFGDAVTQIYLIFHPGVTLPENYMIWPWQPLIIPTSHALPLLIGSLALGVIQIFTGMGVSIYMKVKRGEVMSALTDEVTWYLVFILGAIGILFGCLKPMLIAIVVLLVLTQGYGKKGVGILTGIGGSLYNHITGYFSDILSYSRLMALMLAGAVIAQVFNQLGALFGNIVGFLIVSIIGNALNMGLNLLGCYVHDMRLQCLEFFGRFYADGGKPFNPLSIKAKYLDIKKS